MLGPLELAAIIGLVVLLVGAKRIPKLGRNLGKATEWLRRADEIDGGGDNE